tara:strand:+ start:92 stop:712 length:621 start_codon:yes stop_codon:yes gene_type:complete
MNLEVIKPFGPSIVKLKLPQEIIDKMNKYTDEVITNKKKSENLDHGSKLAGNVYQEILLDLEFMKKIKWAEFLAKACEKWLQQENNKQLKNFKLIESWIVRQFKHDYNPIHFHSGHISGVGYLKVPKNMGKTSQKNKKNNQNGKLELIECSPKLFCKGNYIVEPEVGNFYLFPNYLFHTVYPFSDSEEERRSISFNARIDELSAAL